MTLVDQGFNDGNKPILGILCSKGERVRKKFRVYSVWHIFRFWHTPYTRCTLSNTCYTQKRGLTHTIHIIAWHTLYTHGTRYTLCQTHAKNTPYTFFMSTVSVKRMPEIFREPKNRLWIRVIVRVYYEVVGYISTTLWGLKLPVNWLAKQAARGHNLKRESYRFNPF